MKTRSLIIYGIVGTFIVALILFYVGFSLRDEFFDSANPSIIANNTASKHGNFSHAITWNVYIEKNGKIYAVNGDHKIDRHLDFSCMFTIIPNDTKDHYAYLSVFRSDDAGYVVLLDEKTGILLDSKPVPLESAVCGP